MAMPAYGSPKSTKVTAFSNWSPSSTATAAISASQKSDKTNWPWTSTDPKHTHFVWDGTRLLQEYTYKGHYTYICATQDSCEPLAPVHNRTNAENRQQTYYFHCDQISIPKEMTGIHGNLLWYGGYTAWDRLKEETRVTDTAYQPFRLQNQYYKGTSWSPSSNINAFIPTDLLTKRR